MFITLFLTQLQAGPQIATAPQVAATPQAVHAQPAARPGLMLPIGGGYDHVYPGIVSAMLEGAHNGHAKITILPASYTTNPRQITPQERAKNLRDAERRRLQVEQAWRSLAPRHATCAVEVAPIFVRADAENPANLRYFGQDVTGVFMLGGDQGAAMQVLAGTPVEEALAALHARGGVVAGTSAGGGMQSRTMIADYAPSFTADNALERGSALLWENGMQRGLSFGLPNAIFDQHFFQRGRMGRLLEAITRPDSPHVGVGLDAHTGVRVQAGQALSDVFGLYSVAVLDAETLGAAMHVQHVGERRTLSLRNVVVNLLAPGLFRYDLAQRSHSLAPAPKLAPRSFAGLALPQGAGALVLAGGSEPGKAAVYARFRNETQGVEAPLLVVATGFADAKWAQHTAAVAGATLGGPVEIKVMAGEHPAPLTLDKPYAGIVVIGDDQALLAPGNLTALRTAWLGGTPLLLDGAAAALAGPVFAKHAPPSLDHKAAELEAQQSFLQGNTVMAGGLNLLPVTVEPQVLESSRWGRLFALAYYHSDLPAFAIGSDTALVIDQDGGRVAGEGTVIALDLRSAAKALGNNHAFVIANALLDVFAPGDKVEPLVTPLSAALAPRQVAAQQEAVL